MVDSIVSVRMPSSLVQRLKELSKENHFLDLSEEVRSIIRIKTAQYRQIPSKEKPKTKDYKTENIVKQELLKKLKDMIRELEDGK